MTVSAGPVVSHPRSARSKGSTVGHLHPTLTAPASGLWHWSPEKDRSKRLDGVDELCARARRAGLDYVAFKSHDGANDRFLDDDQLQTAKRACERHGLRFVLWQYVYAVRPPADE